MKRALPYSLKLIANNAGDNGSVVMQVRCMLRATLHGARGGPCCACALPLGSQQSGCSQAATQAPRPGSGYPSGPSTRRAHQLNWCWCSHARTPASVPQRVLEDGNPNFGYNAATGKYEDLMKAGIIDPAKVSYMAIELVPWVLLFGWECIRGPDEGRHHRPCHGQMGPA